MYCGNLTYTKIVKDEKYFRKIVEESYEKLYDEIVKHPDFKSSKLIISKKLPNFEAYKSSVNQMIQYLNFESSSKNLGDYNNITIQNNINKYLSNLLFLSEKFLIDYDGINFMYVGCNECYVKKGITRILKSSVSDVCENLCKEYSKFRKDCNETLKLIYLKGNRIVHCFSPIIYDKDDGNITIDAKVINMCGESMVEDSVISEGEYLIPHWIYAYVEYIKYDKPHEYAGKIFKLIMDRGSPNRIFIRNGASYSFEELNNQSDITNGISVSFYKEGNNYECYEKNEDHIINNIKDESTKYFWNCMKKIVPNISDIDTPYTVEYIYKIFVNSPEEINGFYLFSKNTDYNNDLNLWKEILNYCTIIKDCEKYHIIEKLKKRKDNTYKCIRDLLKTSIILNPENIDSSTLFKLFCSNKYVFLKIVLENKVPKNLIINHISSYDKTKLLEFFNELVKYNYISDMKEMISHILMNLKDYKIEDMHPRIREIINNTLVNKNTLGIP